MARRLNFWRHNVNRKGLLLGAAGFVVAGGLAAVGVYSWVLGPTLAASGEMTPIPVLPAEITAAPAATEPVAATAEVVPTHTAASEASPAAEVSDTGDLTVLQIVPSESQARFILSEVLRGQPTTVVGATDQVAGEIAVNPNDLSTAQVGVIQVNARDLTTDSNQRNQAIRNRILHTDNFEFITFAPTSVIGLDGSAQPGDTFTFQLAGDLTIRDITQPVTFEVTATVEALNQLSGTAVTTVQRAAYGLNIPSVPHVADVSEEVRVELDFVAAAGS
jgi:polyisoprenoid-binding protein YceI